MSTRSATPARPARRSTSKGPGTRSRANVARKKAEQRRRRVFSGVVALITLVIALIAIRPAFHHTLREITLPLRHEDIIRQQARQKGIDPSLIAGVIYTESRFRDGQVSSAGAQGLMQLTPATAHDIARKSGGTSFSTRDLDTAQVNIAYGAYYLRYLLGRYGGNETLALAAYNAGEGNVDKWIDRYMRSEGRFRPQDIPFPETRAYVSSVEDAQAEYRRSYASELGL